MPDTEAPSNLICRWRDGDNDARDRLFAILYDDFEAIASALLRKEQHQISLLTGDLLNEAIVRIFRTPEVQIADRPHLLALAARVMRRVLLDAARSRNRQKRKGLHITLSEAHEAAPAAVDYGSLERALMRLGEIDPARAAIVEMRYFGGMTIEEIAQVRGVSASTVKRSWEAARLWLRAAMEHDVSTR